ncbi:PssE/Cps14G family polysaccharide biosynthesis glycosyltransferase [Anaeromicropila herbilytica]|uniref:Beta-1,4-galactosyltransferase n=1 Tax=Anaeromicropila herbilytica TaxID=2785025 RepID=A0A7R7EIE3_9FIRM|nr:PssE/Cps14G family polysaccharide biosynthesis glycosyltransferase [Anaeromicropila herbilytica]BCN29012.1 beta-1,4-galactosyltransferase [Anaeromicropila herbilytica]
MIFVVLGTQKFQLNRLLKEVDDLIERGDITEEVMAQIGFSDYEPKNYKYYRFLDKDQFDNYIAGSTMVITHSGVGSILAALKVKKPVVIYPRLKKYHEHVDDHQLDIARAFEKKKYVICKHDDETLAQAMQRCDEYPFEEYVSNTNNIIGMIQDFLDKNTIHIS